MNRQQPASASDPLVRIPASVARQLGFYIYAYVNPLDGEIFYIGKGKGQRALAHLQDTSRSDKVRAIRQIVAAGKAPEIHILAHGLKDEEAALRVEAAVIDALGLPSQVATKAYRHLLGPDLHRLQ